MNIETISPALESYLQVQYEGMTYTALVELLKCGANMMEWKSFYNCLLFALESDYYHNRLSDDMSRVCPTIYQTFMAQNHSGTSKAMMLLVLRRHLNERGFTFSPWSITEA